MKKNFEFQKWLSLQKAQIRIIPNLRESNRYLSGASEISQNVSEFEH